MAFSLFPFSSFLWTLLSLLFVFFSSSWSFAEECPHGSPPNQFIITYNPNAQTRQSSFHSKGLLKNKTANIHLQVILQSVAKKILPIGPSRPRRQEKSVFPKTVNNSVDFVSASVVVAPVDAQFLKQEPGIVSMEPDCFVKLNALPDDPLLYQQWSRPLVQMDSAWDVENSVQNVLVAVSDNGIDYRHEDLAENIWTNELEVSGTKGIDDDQNGCVDDFYGCDLADDDNDPSPGQTSTSSHGTHVAGIIGAVGGNGIGVAGVAWRVPLLIAKGFSNNNELSPMSNLLRTIYYSVNTGAKIINCSWGLSRKPSIAETLAFQYALRNGVLPIVAAGNEATLSELTSPAGIPGLLVVGATNSRDQLSSFSIFGYLVRILAPGGDSRSWGGPFDESVFSTMPTSQGQYGFMRGTSMAAPLVSGLAALALSINPKLTPEDLIVLLTTTGDIKSVNANDANQTRYLIPRVNALNVLKAAKTFQTGRKSALPNFCPVGFLCEEPSSPARTAEPQVSEQLTNGSSGGSCQLKLARSVANDSSNFAASFSMLALLLPLLTGFFLRK